MISNHCIKIFELHGRIFSDSNKKNYIGPEQRNAAAIKGAYEFKLIF